MSGIFADIFAFDDVGEDDILVSSSGDELAVVLADVQRVDVVVMYIFVIFDHMSFAWIVKTHAAIFGTCHAVLSVGVELYCVDWAAMDLG
jgi:hypothetical protein